MLLVYIGGLLLFYLFYLKDTSGTNAISEYSCMQE